MKNDLEFINCPLCNSNHSSLWAIENEFHCVKCLNCELIYVNPRPSEKYIEQAVSAGTHLLKDGLEFSTKTRRLSSKISYYRKSVKAIFNDFEKRECVNWLDVGAGYGEFVEALNKELPKNSIINGIEPMLHKTIFAQKMGLPIKQGFITDLKETYDVVSLIDVFSHIPDFHNFLNDVKKNLNKRGEILIKTGNASEIGDRSEFPGPLNIPDHLVFGGQAQLKEFLEGAGFSIISVQTEPIDDIWYTFKNTLKFILQKPVKLSFPFTSPTRTIWIRARLDLC